MIRHGLRILALIAFTTVLLGWLGIRAEVLFIDGLRYIAQARQIAAGHFALGIWHSVDHPMYPLAVAGIHELRDGVSPESWQGAAQLVSIGAAVLLVIPLYLFSLELFGQRAAWLGTLLFYILPTTSHVMADALSEPLFLLFWTTGLWCAMRFLRQGTFIWLPCTILAGGLAYLTRPEGILLPAALVATLFAMPLLSSTRLNWPRWWSAVAFLVLSSLVVIVPLVAAKGTLGTKPAIAKILGLAPPAAADAVERAEPLDPTHSTTRIALDALKGVWRAARDAVTLPLLLLGTLGLFIAAKSGEGASRVELFLRILLVGMLFGLWRLHMTGGYCTTRHALVLSVLLVPAAVRGLEWVLSRIMLPGKYVGLGEGKYTPGPAVWLGLVIAFCLWMLPGLVDPIGGGNLGYRLAAEYLEQNAAPNERVVDVTGLAPFYSNQQAITFRNLDEAFDTNNPPRWVVARSNHLIGPWGYCRQLKSLIAGHRPVAAYPERVRPGQSLVLVYDRNAPAVAIEPSPVAR
jgi:hypothetical protein